MENKTQMFVYGTLVSDWTRDSLGITAIDMKEAMLPDYAKQGLNVVSKKGTTVPGMTFFVNDKDLAKLDRYEGLPGLYSRKEEKIKVNGKTEKANIYQLNR